MKKITTISLFALIMSVAMGQEITETVTIEPGQTNQTWYSLENGSQGTALASEWDLAFDLSSFGTSIHANTAIGISVWVYQNGDISDWSTVDTTGLSTWNSLYNSDTSWALGAFDVTANASNPFDVGWGIYNSTTHIITGDSIHIVKLANGDYKKLKIENLSSGSYNFTYADLDGNNEVATSLTKADFQDKLFGYYSIQNEEELDREPVASSEWDLLFTKYTAFIPVAYPVAGILSSSNVQVAEVNGVTDVPNFNDWQSQDFTTKINEIGYDWKSFNGSGYDIASDVVYFVKTQNEDIWKVVPTGFGGSATGDFEFTKEKLSTASLGNVEKPKVSFTLYPNPNNTDKAHLIYSAAEKTSFKTTIISSTGRIVDQFDVEPNNSFETQTIDVSRLESGIYFVEVTSNGQKATQKLIIQK
ncbi:MAG: T9SS type A sorting domain-containing protein [Brumimicrobium sp.]